MALAELPARRGPRDVARFAPDRSVVIGTAARAVRGVSETNFRFGSSASPAYSPVCNLSGGRAYRVRVLAWQRIRVLRARPPARIEDDDERAAVFVSALEQAEELMHAAANVGAAASPLLLFYAVSQAGRAIAAARLDDPWRPSGHGLKAPAPGDALTGLLQRLVKPDGGQASGGRRPSFAGVAEATGSGQLTSEMELGALWAAIPEFMAPLPQPPLADPAWKRPLRVFRTVPDAAHLRLADMPLELLIDGLPPNADLDTLLRYLSDYPTAEGAYMWHTQGMREDVLVTQPSPVGLLPVFCWPDVPTDIGLRARQLNTIAPDYRSRGTRLLLPRAGSRDALSPLMLWWALLFGLSSIARYDPQTWVGALAVNDSELAVPIEAALAAALEALPDLILDALIARP